MIRAIAATPAGQATASAKTCGLSTGNPKVPALIATQGPLRGDDCTIPFGSTLAVQILTFVLWDQDDPSKGRATAAAWKAEVSIDGIALTNVNGGGPNTIDTGYFEAPVVAKSTFPLDPSKSHRFLGYFPSVLIEGLSKGTHQLSGHYVIIPGEAESSFTYTITVT